MISLRALLLLAAAAAAALIFAVSFAVEARPPPPPPPQRLAKRLARDPMPWEDNYFDPAYHAWPKGGGASTKQDKVAAAAKRLVDDSQVTRR